MTTKPKEDKPDDDPVTIDMDVFADDMSVDDVAHLLNLLGSRLQLKEMTEIYNLLDDQGKAFVSALDNIDDETGW